ncbi:antitoxin VapB family protein [Candidatus Woesearchaeota archaeon]|nr:antitoxin VapB family protein [Candidatus Woesearchaeota archaeon]
MASLNISIRREAYDFLHRLKSKNKSFSDVILGFKKDQSDLMMFFGVLRESDWKEKGQEMKEFRTSFDKRLQ